MKLLIVDDEDSFRQHLCHLFERRGFTAVAAKTGQETLEIAKRENFDIVLLDIVLPDIDGIEILKNLKRIYQDTQIIMMTGNATIENAIASMKLGAYDYLIKPFDLEELIILVERAGELTQLKRESEIFKRELDKQKKYTEIVGNSSHINEIMDLIEKVAPTNSTVLITGETGTGKELVAKAIHQKSPRKDKPFVIVNCSAIQDTLLESEMFGHEKGAFTGAVKFKRGLVDVADSGTLFLDEIGDVSIGFQTKLLRFLESGEYRPVGSTQTLRSEVRIIAATNRNLLKLLKEEKFREDLFYRLNVFNIELKPLRERKEDIPILVQYCLKKICYQTGKCLSEISPEALELLHGYTWPGNVRELENVIERAVILSDGHQIQKTDLPIDIKHQLPSPMMEAENGDESLTDVEMKHLIKILQKTDWNKTKAAKLLGITKKTLYRKLEIYGIKK